MPEDAVQWQVLATMAIYLCVRLNRDSSLRTERIQNLSRKPLRNERTEMVEKCLEMIEYPLS